MDALSIIGELDILVIIYVRRTCERGRTERPDITALSEAGDDDCDRVELDETEDG